VQEALGFLPAALPDVRLAAEPQYDSIDITYGLERLPVSWG
jgi:hypothetical protein